MGDAVPPSAPGIFGVEADGEKGPAQANEGHDDLDGGETGSDRSRFLDADDVHEDEAKKEHHGSGDDQVLGRRHEAGEVIEARHARDGRGQEIVDRDEGTAHQGQELKGGKGLAHDGNHAAAVRTALADFDIFQGNGDEDAGGDELGQGGQVADGAVKDAGGIKDGSADVGINDGKDEDPAQLVAL